MRAHLKRENIKKLHQASSRIPLVAEGLKYLCRCGFLEIPDDESTPLEAGFKIRRNVIIHKPELKINCNF